MLNVLRSLDSILDCPSSSSSSISFVRPPFGLLPCHLVAGDTGKTSLKEEKEEGTWHGRGNRKRGTVKTFSAFGCPASGAIKGA